jgi:hypothetical protein
LLRFLVGLAFLHGKRKEHPAGSAGSDFIVRNAVLVDFSGEKELTWIIPSMALIIELHNGQPIIEGFKDGFLPFASEHMSKDEDRLALTLDTEILQRSL